MDKLERKYKEEYSDIPKRSLERLFYLIDKLNIKKGLDKLFDKIRHILNIKYKEISFVIYLEPKATPRPRANRKANVFYVSEAANNRKRFRKFISKLDIDMIYTGTKLYCNTYTKIPSSMSKIEQIIAEMGFIPNLSRPDWDNLGKTYSDMIQEQLLFDDSLIFKAKVSKYYSCKPRIEITLKYMEEFESDYNRKKIMNKKKL